MISTQIVKDCNFMKYWVGSLFSGLGDAVFALCLTWMVYDATDSGAVVGALFLTLGAPQVLLTAFAGVLVDRINPIKAMILCGWSRVLLIGFLFLLSAFGSLPLWSLFAAAFGFGTLEAFFWPAASAVRQRLVKPELYTQSNGLLMIAMKTTAVIGPLAGGTLTALGSDQTVLLLIIAAFFGGVLLLMTVKIDPLAAVKQEGATKVRASYWMDLQEGVSFILRTPILLVTSLTAFLVNACASVVPIGAPFLASALGGGEQEFGWLNASIGVGGTVGAILFALLVIRRPTPRMTLIACFFEGLIILLLGLTGHLLLALLLLALFGITDAAINVIAPSVTQSIVPPQLMGRVVAVMILLMSGSVPIARAASGYLVEAIGVNSVLALNGTVEMLIVLAAFFLPAIRNYRTSTKVVADSL
ncbi:MFS transporter [Tumebacillus lipolyticus]|uniref:MFS transporter n=1 Tax=Tumebacillus lipolyticus TaxID=1280370 RepID=A0ABW4ZT27_9BACL